jgi:hypothetical protein
MKSTLRKNAIILHLSDLDHELFDGSHHTIDSLTKGAAE